MQGASPLASPGLNPNGTGIGDEPRARRGAGFSNRRLTLPLWYPAGWCAFFVAGAPCLQLTFFPPSPLPPLPGGKGGIFCFLMQGASPLASPGLSRKRHWDRGANRAPGGGWLSRLLADLAVPEAAGAACLLCRLSTLPSAYVLSPIPRPPSPPGKGEIFCFLMQGASPLASPGLSRKRHWDRERTTRPAGGVPSLSPARPAFSLLPCPHPPYPPLPGGKGGLKVYFAGGSAPGTPALNRLQHWLALPLWHPARAQN